MVDVRLYCGDCLDILPTIEPGSVDAIITDLPYGTTACSWDEVIPFEPMWAQVKRVLKPRGVFVTTASQPFTSKLIMSNPKWFKYSWVWKKDQVSNPQLAKVMPLKDYEDIPVFSRGGNKYSPQGLRRAKIARKVDSAGKNLGHLAQAKDYTQEFTSYPKMVLEFATERGLHPTQKPVSLYEYLILTYTNPGDTVMDICHGSGTTGVACARTGRNYIGIEKRPDYFDISQQYIKTAQQQQPLFMEV